MLRVLKGRSKLVILAQLSGSTIRRFSVLERAIPDISRTMLIQPLRQLEADGVATRIVYAEVPPWVEYQLTEWGQIPRQTRSGSVAFTPTPQEPAQPPSNRRPFNFFHRSWKPGDIWRCRP